MSGAGGRPTYQVIAADPPQEPRDGLRSIEETRAHRSRLIDVGRRLSVVRGVLQDRGEHELATSVAESQDGLMWVVGELSDALARVADEGEVPQ